MPVFLAAAVVVAILGSQPAPRERVGPLPGGGLLLNTGWKLEPAGRQIPLGAFPTALAVARDGSHLFVLNAGDQPSLTAIEADSGRATDSAAVVDTGIGLTISPRGDRIYVAGGAHASLYEFTYSGGKLQPARTFALPPDKRAPSTAGDFIGDVAFSPDGRLLYATDVFDNAIWVINPQSGTYTQRFKAGQRPYRILFSPDGKSFFVTSDGTLTQYDTATGSNIGVVRIGPHPTAMVWRNGGPEVVEGVDRPAWTARMFVAAANTNNVYSVGVGGGEMSRLETINVGFSPQQPLGMTPSALALSSDGKRLYVACSGANAIAVVDVSGERGFTEGFIPVGWYPTAVAALKSGAVIAVNAKSPGSANGSASWIDSWNSDQLSKWTQTAISSSPYGSGKADQPSPLPAIDHVIYIVKGSRGYDQVLGDLKEGDGDPSRAAFGERVTPNLHKLAREFVLLDNFYVNGDSPADGLQWSTAGIANDFLTRLSHSRGGETMNLERQEPALQPPAGYLWTNAVAAGIAIRNEGFFVRNGAASLPVTSVDDPVLARPNNTNRMFRGLDPDFPDTERAKAFVADLAEFEKSGSLPRLIVVRLANDGASSAVSGKIAPASAVADNDYALGLMVDAISHSNFWQSTAIFVLEADAQGASDHVDSHRSPAFVISPYVKRHSVNGAIYNTVSVLRTAELLLGLRPMTHFDAGALPMAAVFQAAPDASPYTAEKPRIRLDERNP